MDTLALSQTTGISDADFARMRLLKGADVDSLDGLLDDCPVIDVDENQLLADVLFKDYSLLVLLSGRLEMSEATDLLPKTVTAGDYVGGLNACTINPAIFNYQAAQATQVLAFDDEMLNSLMMVSHSAAVNLSALAMEQLRHIPAANDSNSAGGQAAPAIEPLPAPVLHDAQWLEEMLDRQIIRSLTDQEPLSLAILEIDNTSEYMAKHGDESLPYVSNSVAHCIVDNVRPGDMVARIDESHFVVVLPRATAKDARRPAGRLSREIAQTEIVIPNDCTLPPVSISVGITQLKAMVGAEKFVAEGIEALQRANVNGPGSISD